jgi:spermidine synthase
VVATLEAVGLSTTPLHVHVPSFGEWGFVMASNRAIPKPGALPAGLRFLNKQSDALAFFFPPDMARRATPVNRLDNQVLVREFEAEWAVFEG